MRPVLHQKRPSQNVTRHKTIKRPRANSTQSLSWDVLTGRVWASEVRYDSFGRPALGTLSAPINNTGSFAYKPDFILTPSGVLNLSHYDGASTLLNPSVISNTPNSLGWYYSDVNTLDAYQDITSYPYTRTVFSELNPGAVKAVLGGNKINNEWKIQYIIDTRRKKCD